ncbi:MAG: tetratricopeptide repeat protein [Myxococcales bacterium]|nr:tetratricopeptide repeat protein [Myxococcales bacterium]
MISCGQARMAIVESVRGQASEATRLALEAHLDRCDACCRERARWSLVNALVEYEPPTLGSAARRRIADRLVAAPRSAPLRVLPGRNRYVYYAGALAAAAALLLLVGRGLRKPQGESGTATAMRAPLPEAADGTRLCADHPGQLQFGGADVAYRPGTALVVRSLARTLVLERGEVEVEVHPAAGRRFRVTTPHFQVEVIGTKFVVAPSGMRTLRGKVRILDLQEHELAVVPAGGSWSPPGGASEEELASCVPAAPPPPAVAPSVAPSAAPPPVAAAPPPVAAAPLPVAVAPQAAGPVAGALIGQARSALSDGDLPHARGLLRRALATRPSQRERASIQLLQADGLLTESRYDQAVNAYRSAARAFPDLPEGEAASFAVGQVLAEHQRAAEAESALRDYVARYPRGRFLREARERLSELRPTDR